jgi:hypothetical protein
MAVRIGTAAPGFRPRVPEGQFPLDPIQIGRDHDGA